MRQPAGRRDYERIIRFRGSAAKIKVRKVSLIFAPLSRRPPERMERSDKGFPG